MRIVELNGSEFSDFANNHPLRNYCQTIEYAKVMSDMGYTHDLIGYRDDSNNLVAASLVLRKKIGTFAKFVYAPKGFLIDYYNTELLKKFIKDVCSHYRKKGYSFLKINPEIIIGNVDKNNFTFNYNQNVNIIDVLKDANFKRRREIYPLDFLFPRINPYINLKEYSQNEKLNEILDLTEDNGLTVEVLDIKDIDILYDIASKHSYQTINYFKSILNHFGNNAELILVKANYEKCLISARERYNKELENNNYYNERLQTDSSDEAVNKKMQSDKDLLKYKNQVVDATAGLKLHKFKYIGGAVIVKYQNRVSIVLEDYDNDNVYAQYYLYNYLINNNKEMYEYLELNGLASDFSENSIYYDFNKVKLDFDPIIYEFIGEFDIVLNELLFKKIQSKGLLSKEFLPSHKFEQN